MSKVVVHNIVTLFVVHNVIYNAKLCLFKVIMNDKRSQFSIMNDTMNEETPFPLQEQGWYKSERTLLVDFWKKTTF